METGTDKTCHGKWISEEYEPGLVSVIIPTYNRAKYIIEAMDSVFAQTYRPIELIIVDDASTDNTSDLVVEWHAERSADTGFRFVYLRQPENRGAPAARNLGAIKSKGQFIVFHDSDDLMDENRIQLQIQRIVKENAELCEGSWKSLPPETKSYRCQIQSSDMLLDFFKNRVSGATVCWMIRRDLMCQVGPWDESLVCYQDIDLTFRLLALHPKVSFEPDSVVLLRKQHDGRITSIRETEQGYKSAFKIHHTRCTILRGLPVREQYLIPEAHQLIHFAILAYARDFHTLALEFESLSQSISTHTQWGNTMLEKFLFTVGGVSLCGGLMALKRKFLKKT